MTSSRLGKAKSGQSGLFEPVYVRIVHKELDAGVKGLSGDE
jgi:hypothetical protein